MTFHSSKTILPSALLCVSLLIPSAHASSTGTSIFSFLKIAASARSSGMGEMAAVPSSLSLTMNPATLPWIGHNETAFNHLSYVSDISYSLVSCAFMINPNMAVAGTFGYLGAGGLQRTVADGSLAGYSESGNFDYNDLLFQTAFGVKTGKRFSWGAALTGVRETIDKTSNSGIMFSAGGLYNPGKKKWTLGFGVKDAGPRVNGYDLPMAGYFGFGRMVSKKTFWGGEAAYYLDNETVLRTGLEYSAGSHVSLRGGYRHLINDPRAGDFPRVNFTAGLGFMFDPFALDYAWLPYGDLGDTHRLTLGARFGKSAGKPAAPGSLKRGIENIPGPITIAVIDFVPKNVAASDAVAVSNFFREAFSDMEDTQVIERERVTAALQKGKTGPNGVTNAAVVSAGKETGAQRVITGTFARYLDSFFVSVQVFDVKSGGVIRTLDQSVDKVSDIRAMCADMAEKARE